MATLTVFGLVTACWLVRLRIHPRKNQQTLTVEEQIQTAHSNLHHVSSLSSPLSSFSSLASAVCLPSLRAVALDLDGTLLSSHHTVSEATSQVLADLHSLGVHIIVATGRTLAECMHYTPFLPPTVTFAACNGAHLAGWQEGQCTVRTKNVLRPAVALEVVRVLMENNIVFCLFELGNAFVSKPDHVELFACDATQRTYCPDFSIHANSENIMSVMVPVHFQPHMLTSPTNVASSAERASRLADAARPIVALLESLDLKEVQVIQSSTSSGHGSYIDVISCEAGKGPALRRVCKDLQIDMEHIVSFGDSDNDLVMLQETGYSVAPSNGNANAKKAAKMVSQWSNDEDCVRKELQHFLESRRNK